MGDLQLVREQARVLSGPATPARVVAQGVCPFKGLASFEPADADYFFGRERLIAELVARLVGASFLGVVGASGSGKSSVLRAGLLPALAGGVLPGSERWRRVLMRPGERPLDELRRVLGARARRTLSPRLSTRCLPANGFCSRSTSWRSCSPPAATPGSAAGSSRRSSERPVTRRAVRSSP